MFELILTALAAFAAGWAIRSEMAARASVSQARDFAALSKSRTPGEYTAWKEAAAGTPASPPPADAEPWEKHPDYAGKVDAESDPAVVFVHDDEMGFHRRTPIDRREWNRMWGIPNDDL
jgi:hypothetical protein